MRRFLMVTALLLSLPAYAVDKVWYVPRDSTSVVLSGIYLYDSSDGVDAVTTIDNTTTGLVIRLWDGANLAEYTVADSEVEAITTCGTYAAPTSGKVRFDGCSDGGYQLYLPDATFTNESQFLTVRIYDSSTPGFMDWDGEVFLDALTPDDIETAVGAQLTADNIATSDDLTTALSDIGTTIAAEIIEDQGATYSLGCAQAALLAYAFGEWTRVGNVVTYEDPSGTETRVTVTLASDGLSRSNVTITCP